MSGWIKGLRLSHLLGAVAMSLLPASAQADQPKPWEVTLQEPVSPIAERIGHFHTLTQVIIFAITLFVLALLIYVMWRFNAARNPVPTRTAHNTLIEVLWTVVPVLILVGIAIFSFPLLFAQYDPALAIAGYDKEKEKPLTIKATAAQWFWTYNFPDNEDVSVESRMLTDAERTDPANQPRLLAVNNVLVVPQGTVVRLQVTSSDVIHAFAMPSMGLKVDAVPGRLNETWFRADKPGMFYGQCSELCGKDHAFMPIAMRVVTPAQFNAWVAAAKTDLRGAYQKLTVSVNETKNQSVAAK